MAEYCAICSATFANAAELLDHMKTDHENPAPDEAGGVGSTAVRPSERFLCVGCGAEFPTSEALRAHNLIPHPVGRKRPTRAPSKESSA